MSTNTLTKQKLFSAKSLLSWSAIFLGSAIFSVSIALFITPYNIIPGGVYGIGIILHNFFPNIMVGTFGIAMEIPLLVIAFFALGKGTGAKTVFAAAIIPLMMNLFTAFIGGTSPELILSGSMNLSDDVLIASIFGGAGMGLGVGMIFANQGTSGGTDIISMIISKYGHFKLSKVILVIESIIVIIGMIALQDWKLPLYSIMSIFILTTVMDYVIGGASSEKLLFIISKKHIEITNYVINDLNRGGTYIKAEGMYTHENKNIVFVVIDRKELPMVRLRVKEIDPEAFMVVSDAHETLGYGFKPFSEIKKIKKK